MYNFSDFIDGYYTAPELFKLYVNEPCFTKASSTNPLPMTRISARQEAASNATAAPTTAVPFDVLRLFVALLLLPTEVAAAGETTCAVSMESSCSFCTYKGATYVLVHSIPLVRTQICNKHIPQGKTWLKISRIFPVFRL